MCNESLDQCADCLTNADCDDGLFCTGIEICADVFCEPGADPCPTSTCYEPVGRCIPNSCGTPVVVGEASRYVAVTPAHSIGPVAILVSGDMNDPDVACFSLFVQPNGTLGTNPVYRNHADWATVHVRGAEIVPDTTYEVMVDCGAVGLTVMSESVLATTWRWGDPARNNIVNLDDILCVVTGFGGTFNVMPSFCSRQMVDLMGCMPNAVIDIDDILAVLNAFGGATFPCGQPCP
jgi:hypothetical protein